MSTPSRPDRLAVRGAQNVSRMCLVCGRENVLGLQGRFLELETGELLGIFRPLPEHQSYPGRLHGGIASAMLDETIGRAINVGSPGSWGVTVDLRMRFRRPVPLNREVRVVGRITGERGRRFEGSGELLLDDGTVAVEATGTYLRLPIERIVEGDFSEDWFPDPEPLPADVRLEDVGRPEARPADPRSQGRSRSKEPGE